MKTKRKNRNQPKIDWNEAFIFYCEPWESGKMKSLMDVKKKYELHYRTVQERSKKDKWIEKRTEMSKKALKAWEDSQEDLIKKTAKKQFHTWSRADKILNRQLDLLEKEQESGGKEGKKKKIYATELVETLRSAEIVTKQTRIILGMPTEISKAEVKNTNFDGDKLTEDEIKEMDEGFESGNNVTKDA